MPEMDEAVLKRVLPHSIEAEQSVIGSMLMDKEAITIASEQLHGEDFYGKQYGILFDAMVELNDEGKPVDLVTLQQRLKERSYIAAKQFRISDRDILNAILFHTTGRPGMSQLEKIIYIADYIEPGRKHAPNLPKVRKLAFQDLDEALLKILEDTLGYLGSVGGSIDPMTKRTYDYYEAYMRIEKRQED